MAASRGVDNWNDNFKGQGDVSTLAKVDTAILYEENGSRSSQQLTRGTPVTYIDNQSKSHTRVAIQIGENTYLTNIDNLQKPQSVGRIDLKPQAFGLGGQSLTLTNYISTVKQSINGRQEIKGDLKDYLLDLVKTVEFGANSITGYDTSEFPMGSILSDFGEVLGPIYCIKRGLTNKNLGVNQSSSVFFPVAGAEPLLDYFIKTSTDTYKISAKAKGTANTLKMNSLVPALQQNNTLLSRYQNSIEFRLMKTIHDNSTNNGAILGAALIGAISQQAAASVSGLRGNNAVLSNTSKQLFSNIIQNDTRLRTKFINEENITLRNIAYVCEKEIVDFTKQTTVSQKLTNIVKDILNNELFYVKMSIDNGIPIFNVFSTSDKNVSNLIFRNKNGYDSFSDKLGFKI